jgi:hypothetical protein
MSTPLQNMQTGWRIELNGVLSIILNDTCRGTGTVETTRTANFGAAKGVAHLSINQSTPATWLYARETWEISTANFLLFGSQEILCCSKRGVERLRHGIRSRRAMLLVWYYRDYRITRTHFVINEQYGMFQLSLYLQLLLSDWSRSVSGY